VTCQRPSRLRVGLVCPYSLDVPGGVQSHVLGLADALTAAGHDVAVLAPGEQRTTQPDGPFPSYVTTTGRAVPMPYNGSVARVSFGPLVAGRVRRWLADGELDVLHLHEPATPSISVLALWAANVPVVATFHTAQQRPRALETSAATFLRGGLSKIDAHVAVSPEARSTMRRYLDVEPLLIPNGVDLDRFSRASSSGPASGPPVVAFVGRVDEPRKGFRLLLEALPRLLRDHPGTRVVVVGGDRSAARALPEALAPHVEMLGTVSEAEKARVLGAADVLVAPNTHGESFGIVLVEAMAAGAAVAASDLPAFRRVLGDGRFGRLFGTGDPQDLADVVTRMLARPQERQRLAARGREAAAAYDWTVVAPRVADVYTEVLEEQRPVAVG
jgi:phosphatidyl-myo-inositol alpha-mannosyltransferase